MADVNRTELFKIKTCGPMQGTAGLYVKTECGSFDPVSGKVANGTVLSLDTYFNAFSCSKYLRWTCLTTACAALLLKGSFQISLWANRAGINTLLASCEAEGDCTLPFDFSAETGQCRYWIQLEARGEGCRFTGGAYWANAERIPTRLAVVICTYCREEFVLRNMDLFSEHLLTSSGPLADRLEIFVIDNGRTLCGRFPERPGLHLIPNKNLGGSGGFTRGLLEVLARPGAFTHVLLMDDDVVLEPNAIEKTAQFLSLLRPEFSDLHLAGGMLDLDRPYVQCEATARWRKGIVQPLKSGLDLSESAALTANETEEPAEYGGWWFLCMPVSVVREDNLPLPLFIKCDDAEYGLRNIRHITALNGVGLWHKGFAAKYAPWLDYYVNRNIMIVDAIHFPPGARRNIRLVLLKKMLSYLALGIPEASVYVQEAVLDFLRGPSYFAETDLERRNRELRALCPQADGISDRPKKEKAFVLLYKLFTPSFWRMMNQYRRLARIYRDRRGEAEKSYQTGWQELARAETWRQLLEEIPDSDPEKKTTGEKI